FFVRTVHPAPPSDPITVQGQKFDLNALENPFRELEHTEPEAFRTHVENGRRVYYQNCFYCHGDNMLGDGLFAYGLNPIPTNFRDSGTIAMFQEGYLFWRISKGGPGLPGEGGPWESAMPVWENFLNVDEIWDVILFLYDYTEQRPRELEEHGE
ncbi:MAG: cytochrome c, partial [Candidatus Hydrogenedentes bacterium]|nr:cytochrome c [Candidatus Hydrogenedentota bacterium]